MPLELWSILLRHHQRLLQLPLRLPSSSGLPPLCWKCYEQPIDMIAFNFFFTGCYLMCK